MANIASGGQASLIDQLEKSGPRSECGFCFVVVVQDVADIAFRAFDGMSFIAAELFLRRNRFVSDRLRHAWRQLSPGTGMKAGAVDFIGRT